MGFRCGIVGLPNVGKSTLFNALTETAAAQAANYPFCTIEPNVGNVAVPDKRLDQLAAIAGSAKIIETQLGFVDIAGLVRGASRAKAWATSSSATSARCDAIVHVPALLREWRRHPCRGQGRSDRRCRDGRDRTDAVRSRESSNSVLPNFAKKGAGRQGSEDRAVAVLGQALVCSAKAKPARLDQAEGRGRRARLRPGPAAHGQAGSGRCATSAEGDAANGRAPCRTGCSKRPKPRVPGRRGAQPRSRPRSPPWRPSARQFLSEELNLEKPTRRASTGF